MGQKTLASGSSADEGWYQQTKEAGLTTTTTLHEVEESLRELDPETLQEMAYQAHSHTTICELTSQIGRLCSYRRRRRP